MKLYIVTFATFSRMKGFLCLAWLIACISPSVSAQFWKNDTTVHKKEGFFVLPLLYYTPDTRFAAGLMGVYYFRTGDTLTQAGLDTRLSYVKLLADYTQNKQLDVWSSWNIFSNQERYLFKGEARYRNFPDRYYGIGNNTPDENVERYTYDFFSFKILGLRQIAKKLFVGMDYQLTHQYGFSYFDNKELVKGTVPGFRGGTSSALGCVLTRDMRDNVVNAHSGSLLELSSYFNSSYLGSSFDYINVNFTYNAYFNLGKNRILAFNTVGNFNTQGVPFIEMAKVGNDDILRGYARNRFRDLNFVATQAEFRFHVWKRLGGVVFTGVGDVFQSPKDLRLDLLKYTYGTGLRFAINSKERLNVRFDYGWGRGEQSFYITLTEAF